MMSSTTRRRIRRKLGLDKPPIAYLGRLSDLAVRNTADGTYYVREELASGSLAPPVSLPLLAGAYVQPKYNIAVELGYDRTGQRVILGMEPRIAALQGINPLALNSGDPASRGLIRQEELGNLLCRPHPVEAFTAQVLPGKIIFGSTAVENTGAEIDLSGDLPGSGLHQYVGVFLRSDGSLVRVKSTPQSTASALDLTDVQEVLDRAPADSLLLRVYQMTAGDTGLDGNYDDSPDWRPLWAPVPESPSSLTSHFLSLRSTGALLVSRSTGRMAVLR